jgi:hypothetical protein
MNNKKRNNIRNSKRAVIEVSFSWIFILIAGVVILGLFVYVGFNQGNFFKTLINADMLKDLNAIFIAAQVSKNTAAIFSIPRSDLGFDCNSYSIEGVSHSLAGQFVFAPKKLRTDRIISWSKPWSLGFRITNFLYLTSPYIKYYIGYEPSDTAMTAMAQKIYDDFPRHVNVDLFPLDNSFVLENQNFDNVVILLLNKNENYDLPSSIYDKSEFKKYKKDELIFLHARSPDTSTIEGSLIVDLIFKDKDFTKIGTEMTVYDISSLYGAFISGNYETTRCVLSNAFGKATDVAYVYNYRIENLNNLICSVHYSIASSEFSKMINNLDSSKINVVELKSNIVSLISINNMLETYSCPLIY